MRLDEGIASARRLNNGTDAFNPVMPAPAPSSDGVHLSERGRFRILQPGSNGTVGLAAVGHVYLWPVPNQSPAERHSWILVPVAGGGYVFYSDFDGGSWLQYRAADDYLLSLPNRSEATAWSIEPPPEPALLRGSLSMIPPAGLSVYRIKHFGDGRLWKINNGRISPEVIPRRVRDCLRRRLNAGIEPFTPIVHAPRPGDGVHLSERGFVRLLDPNNTAVGMAAVGHVYLLPIAADDPSVRHSWKISVTPGGGYVLYNDFDGGSWLQYRASDDTLVSLPGETNATVWSIEPAIDPSMFRL